MNVLQRLRRLVAPIRVAGPVFGPLRFQNAGFWEGWVAFAPTGQRVEVLIDGGRDGPTERQREFFRARTALPGAARPARRTAARDLRHLAGRGRPRRCLA
jgi:hypothetical protein